MSLEMPTIHLGDFEINKSYIDSFQGRSRELNGIKTFKRSKTSNDFQENKLKKTISNTKSQKVNAEKQKISSFHTFNIIRKIGNGAYGRVFLVF